MKQLAGPPSNAVANRGGQPVRTSLDDARTTIQPALRWALFFTFLITVLGFAGPLYMMNVYGRVLASRNETTLVVLTLIVIFAIVIRSIFETVRSDILRRASVLFDRSIAGDVFDSIQKAIVMRPLDRSLPTLRDVEVMRDFITGSALSSMMMLPFFPIFVLVLWIIHPFFVGLIIVKALLIGVINYLTSIATAEPVREAGRSQQAASQRASTAFQNFESVHSMGMRPALRRSWQAMHDNALSWNIAGDDRSVTLRILSAFVSHLGNTATICLAAFLVLHDELAPSLIFACSIITGQATRPLMGLVGAWKAVNATRQAQDRIQQLLVDVASGVQKLAMRPPTGMLAVEDLALAPPGMGVERLLLRGINFRLEAGTVLAIIGPSASGKSSLARALIGVWKPLRGVVRIDGDDLVNWDDEQLGPYLGYLSQNVELFPGTIAENIARFSHANHEAIIEAAEQAGVHSMIQALPDGYNTKITENGGGLSGGQRQRIGLARAIFGKPALVVLDEPNSNLDAAGEEQLALAIKRMKENGTTVVFVTHKVSVLSVADVVLVLGGGTMKDFGPCSEVMQRFTQPRVVQLKSPQGRQAAAAPAAE